MKRRRFVYLSAVGAAAIYFPATSCRNHNAALSRSLAEPQLLFRICDAKTIREIGQAYLQQTPAEANGEQLVDLLLTDSTGKNISSSVVNSALHALLDKKIQQDFETGRTVIVKGWVLSLTEARQCALYAANQK